MIIIHLQLQLHRLKQILIFFCRFIYLINYFFFQIPAQPSQQPNAAAYLTPSQPSTYQPSAYTPVPTPVAVQKPTDQYSYEAKPTATNVDVSEHERKQADLEAREKRVAERERVLANADGAISMF